MARKAKKAENAKKAADAAAAAAASAGAPQRLVDFAEALRKKRVDAAVVRNEANVRALTGIECDNAMLLVYKSGEALFHTDFRYIPMVHRVAPWIDVKEIKKFSLARDIKAGAKRIGYESCWTVKQFENFKKKAKGAEFVDVLDDILALRAVKTPEEQQALRKSEALNDRIWSEAQKQFKAGMTERQMARIIKHLMIEKGEGEAFETIVCVGANAAECHHVPDDTVWDGKSPVLVDMGVKLGGYCSDMTRNIVPRTASKRYREIYAHVLGANEAAIAALRPGMTSGDLDKVARDYLEERGFKEEFGHSLGHGVGIEIHESPWAARKQKTVLKPGMSVTIEPGLYIEGELGVRIEDLVLVTEDGCEVISHSKK